MGSIPFKVTRLALAASAGLTCFAMALYPGGTYLDPTTRGYSMFQNSLSDLGSGVSWSGQPNPGAWVHLAASIMLIAGSAACFIGLVRAYSISPATTLLARLAGGLVAVAAIAMTGVAFEPQDRFPTLHGNFTVLALGAFALATLLLSIATALSDRSRRLVPIGWLTLTGVIVAWSCVIPKRPTTPVDLAIPVILQKLVAVVLLATLTFQSYQAERLKARD
jgi:hypothetical protein